MPPGVQRGCRVVFLCPDQPYREFGAKTEKPPDVHHGPRAAFSLVSSAYPFLSARGT